MTDIAKDSAYFEQLMDGPRQEIRLILPENYLERDRYNATYIELLDVLGRDENSGNDTLFVSVPSQLIADGLLFKQGENYKFKVDSRDEQGVKEMSMILSKMWTTFTSFVFKNFLLFVLFTTPFLVFALHLVLRRRKGQYPRGHSFAFSLYYLAFWEILFLFLYIIGFFVDYPDITMVVSLYLAAAIREAYAVKSWFRSMMAALVVNTIYIVCCLAVMFLIVLILLCYYIAEIV